ncbi:MAG: vanadium-dependent haloperoxidase, partial [Flavobacteriales bacterium]
MGEGEILSDLEWDIKSYFLLGGTMHDSAIAAWSVKGWYDYIRPVSAIRHMAEKGQSTDSELPNYDPAGFPLLPGYIEQIQIGDPLAGDLNENVGEIKVLAWKGPYFIEVPATDEAGVGWIMAKDWWPYQRPSFVTPPFAGYVSGHSTFSRAAAEVMTFMTGDEYFPGGMGVFSADRNQFLVFEDGPSIDFELQWATYRDASDQCSLSRIWGGIHPPADDIPGRKMGIQIGNQAFDKAMSYFNPDLPRVLSVLPSVEVISDANDGQNFTLTAIFSEDMNTDIDPGLSFIGNNPVPTSLSINGLGWLNPTTFVWTFTATDANEEIDNITVQISGAENLAGDEAILFGDNSVFRVDSENPIVDLYNFTENVSDATAGTGTFSFALNFSEAMDTNLVPDVSFPTEVADITLTQNLGLSMWIADSVYQVVYDVADNQQTLNDIDVSTENAQDLAGNDIQIVLDADLFSIDMLNPIVASITPNTESITDGNIGLQELVITLEFSENMNVEMDPILSLPVELEGSIVLSEGSSSWATPTTYIMVFDIIDEDVNFGSISAMLSNFQDESGNPGTDTPSTDLFLLDTKAPEITSIDASEEMVADAQVGVA